MYINLHHLLFFFSHYAYRQDLEKSIMQEKYDPDQQLEV